MVQTTEILKILHGMQHDLQAIDQKHTLLLSHTKAQKEKADQDLTAEIAAQEQALKKAETCLIQTRIQIQQDSDKQREQFYEQARQEAVLMSSVIECLEERHVYLKTNDKYFRKYHTKMALTLQQKIELIRMWMTFCKKQDRFMICTKPIFPRLENIGCR